MNFYINTISLLCVIVIGFVAHRASLCNVRAIKDIIDSKNPAMFLSLVQAVLWMSLISAIFILLFGINANHSNFHQPLLWAICGSFLFGFGSTINNGCSLATLNRLADGDMSMIVTLLGVIVGLTIWQVATQSIQLNSIKSELFWLKWPQYTQYILAVLSIWLVWCFISFVRLFMHRKQRSIIKLLLLREYHLSVAAAIFGICGSFLFITQDAWSYTSFIKKGLFEHNQATDNISSWHAFLVLGLITGMLFSALERKTFRLHQSCTGIQLSKHFLGGLCMGLGGALIPGGNDSLLLNGLPSFSIAALLCYIAMLVGIAAPLVALKLYQYRHPPVSSSINNSC